MSKEEVRNKDLFRTSASKICKYIYVPLNVDNRYLEMLQLVIENRIPLLLAILETKTQIGRRLSETRTLGNPYSRKNNYLAFFELFEKRRQTEASLFRFVQTANIYSCDSNTNRNATCYNLMRSS